MYLLNSYFHWACLPYGFEDIDTYEGVHLVAAGWGMTEFGGSVSKVLLKADLPVVSLEDCKESLPNINGSKICTDRQGQRHLSAW